MNRSKPFLFLIPLLLLAGCWSIPRTNTYSQIYSFTREVRTVDLGLGAKKKVVCVTDFREKERYDEDMDELKSRVEQYIAQNKNLSEIRVDNLRALRVIEHSPRPDVEVLLGKPDKHQKLDSSDSPYSAEELWIYRLSKPATFSIAFLPVMFSKESCYIYFKDDLVIAMERHYLEQTFWSSSSGTSDKVSGGSKKGLF